MINYFAKYVDKKIKEDAVLIGMLQNSAYAIYSTSNDPTMVISAASILFYIGFPSTDKPIILPLLRLLQMSTSYSLPAYKIILGNLDMLKEAPHYYHWFYPKEIDSTPVCTIKLKILCKICDSSNVIQTVREIKYWIQ